MTEQRSRQMTDILFTLALFCVFAVCALMVVMMGADVYREGTRDMQHNFDQRTSLAYIGAKLRQSDTQGAISLETLEGVEALVLEETVGSTVYRTWIYCSGGSLREIFTLGDLPPNLEGGQVIMEMDALEVEQLPQGMLRITATEADGTSNYLLYTPRCP